jgi:hypothetical protein
VLLLVDNSGSSRALILPIDNSGRTPALVPLPYDIQIVSVLISLQRRHLRRRYRLVCRWPRDHHSTRPNPSCMVKQGLLTTAADRLFDNDIICILLRKISSAIAPRSHTNMSAYQIPLPRQIIRIQRIRAQIFPVDFNISRTVHIQLCNINFCLQVSAPASRSV